MSANGVNGLPNLNVSPYLTSAVARIQANDLAAKPGAKSAPQSASGGSSEAAPQLLSHQTLGALVAIRSEDNSGC
ncbi:MAG TPA: hypothetical protein VHX92_04910 [Rhizomicrobium sp.]|jgi:hypothetical protein|nr:hypothetical protein [Rhizomicrobium sp.]